MSRQGLKDERRGYAVVALNNPKSAVNVGGAMRAAQVFGASLIVVGGMRAARHLRSPCDTMRAYRHIPVVRTECVFDAVPFDCVPVAVELIEGAQPLERYIHPERAFYIFGAEDATLGRAVVERCRDIVRISSLHCLNLAACVNVVLYDRQLGRRHPKGEGD